MDAESLVVDLLREALVQALVLTGPLLVTAAVIGIVIGLLQAVTQIHDPTLVLVPKLIAMLLVLGIAMPWLTQQLTHYAAELFAHVPHR